MENKKVTKKTCVYRILQKQKSRKHHYPNGLLYGLKLEMHLIYTFLYLKKVSKTIKYWLRMGKIIMLNLKKDLQFITSKLRSNLGTNKERKLSIEIPKHLNSKEIKTP